MSNPTMIGHVCQMVERKHKIVILIKHFNIMKNKTIILMMFVFAPYLVFAQGLKVEPGTCIKVETGTTLDISGGGDLTLKSDDSDDAALIDLGSVNYTGGGEANVERYITNGSWHLISSPIAGATTAMFSPTDYMQYHTESTNGWTDITSLSYSLEIMQGYAFWSVAAGPSTEVFSGVTNTGNQGKTYTKDISSDGYNLVGNPYPSVIDWDEVTIPGTMNGAVWLYDPVSTTYKYYLEGGGGSNTTTQYIPSGQGFFIQATGAGTLSIDNSDRGHNNDQDFYKNTVLNEMLVLKATGNGITTQTAIRFNAGATTQIDRLYDVQKIMPYNPDVPALYTVCENKNMATNTLPSVSGNEIMPVYFEAGTSGNYLIQAGEIESLDAQLPVYLEDVALNYFQDLRVNPEYTINYTSGAQRLLRVHFSEITSIDPENNMPDLVACYLTNKLLHVDFASSVLNDGMFEAQIEVIGMTGQRLISKQTTRLTNEIVLKSSSAVYLVKVAYNNKLITRKVFNQ